MLNSNSYLPLCKEVSSSPLESASGVCVSGMFGAVNEFDPVVSVR